jgi:hypothetical protein
MLARLNDDAKLARHVFFRHVLECVGTQGCKPLQMFLPLLGDHLMQWLIRDIIITVVFNYEMRTDN